MTPELQDRIIRIVEQAQRDMHDTPNYMAIDPETGLHSPLVNEMVKWHACPLCSTAIFHKLDKLTTRLFMGMVSDPNPMLFFQRVYIETIAMALTYAKKGDDIDELEKLFSRSVGDDPTENSTSGS